MIGSLASNSSEFVPIKWGQASKPEERKDWFRFESSRQARESQNPCEWLPSMWACALVVCIQTMQPWNSSAAIATFPRVSHKYWTSGGNLSWRGWKVQKYMPLVTPPTNPSSCSQTAQAHLFLLLYTRNELPALGPRGTFTLSQQCLKICFSPVCRNPACKLFHHFQLRHSTGPLSNRLWFLVHK